MILLRATADLFLKLNNKLPIRVTHLICFLFISRDLDLIESALNLCSKFDAKELINVNNIALHTFNYILIENADNINLITSFYSNYPLFASHNASVSYKLLLDKIEDYFALDDSEAHSDNKENLFNLICVLLNLMAPKQFNSINSASVIEETSLVPSHIMETSPDFWRLYEIISPIINQKLVNDPLLLDDTMSFLLRFPELVDFKVRSSYFRKKMKERINIFGTVQLEVDFNNILSSSFSNIHNESAEEFLNDIQIEVVGKRVYDLGGVKREWFTLLAKEIFNQNYALFVCLKNESYMPSRYSFIHENHLEYFRFAGLFVARALIEGICVDANLASSFCKHILHQKPNIEDLKDIDEELFRSSKWILENDVSSLCLYFEIGVNDFNENKSIPLKENGSNIEVTNENKKEFIDLRTNFVLSNQVQPQIDAFKKGFDSLIPHNYLQIFSPNELNLLICGVPIIDVEDFRLNMTYEDPYNAETPVVKLFFQAISEWENEDLAKLLMFMTGSSRVPINGFSEFVQMTGCPLLIAPGGERTNLPSAHTCINRLDLPSYESIEELNFKMHQAIRLCNSYENI